MTQSRKNRPVVLFDLDGTLTLPRELLEWSLVPVLRKVSRVADIGIVSGSPFSYIDQQAACAWNSIASPAAANFTIMPCNGTQVFRWSMQSGKFVQEYGLDFKMHLRTNGDGLEYHKLITIILELQLQFIADHKEFTSLTGNFVSYRNSMINWSLVGRDANAIERAAFAKLDNKKKVRQKLSEALRAGLDGIELHDMEFALGGTTSIDIYPKGWDKTHALKHFPRRSIWFVGDRCQAGGNDHTIWQALQSTGTSFSTSGPAETIQILEEQILPALEKKNEQL